MPRRNSRWRRKRKCVKDKQTQTMVIKREQEFWFEKVILPGFFSPVLWDLKVKPFGYVSTAQEALFTRNLHETLLAKKLDERRRQEESRITRNFQLKLLHYRGTGYFQRNQ